MKKPKTVSLLLTALLNHRPSLLQSQTHNDSDGTNNVEQEQSDGTTTVDQQQR